MNFTSFTSNCIKVSIHISRAERNPTVPFSFCFHGFMKKGSRDSNGFWVGCAVDLSQEKRSLTLRFKNAESRYIKTRLVSTNQRSAFSAFQKTVSSSQVGGSTVRARTCPFFGIPCFLMRMAVSALILSFIDRYD